MSSIEAFLLGLVQGLTEFLPISSSGHLEIGQALLGTSGESNLLFAIVVHTATVLSTLVVLWKEVAWLLKGLFTTTKWNAEKNYAAKILVSMIPVFIVGMFFKDTVENFFGQSLLLVGCCLLLTACLLACSEYITKKRSKCQGGGEAGGEISYASATAMGLAQAVAVLPGLSRSGSTIAVGLLCGVKKTHVAQFSFLMVIVPILGEAFLSLLELIKEPVQVAKDIAITPLCVGFLSAFVFGCLACRFMINVVRRQKLMYFAYYCVVVGLGTIIFELLS